MENILGTLISAVDKKSIGEINVHFKRKSVVQVKNEFFSVLSITEDKLYKYESEHEH